MPAPSLLAPPFRVDPKRRYSLEEWQTIEELTGERYEFHEGRLVSVQAMAGGTGPHALIGGNCIYVLGAVTRERNRAASSNGRSRSCGVYTSDLRLMLETESRYVYPDAAVICGEPQYDYAIPTAVRNPLVVVEVTSPSSTSFDSGSKFDHYAKLDTLREYVLISQDAPRVEVRSRAEAGHSWTIAVAEGRDTEAQLPALAAGLPLEELYALVSF